MSNIVKARRMLSESIDRLSEAKGLVDESMVLMQNALKFMVRASPLRRAPGKSVRITPELKWKVKRFAKLHPNWTTQEIAVRYGLRNGGRVSEILHDRR